MATYTPKRLIDPTQLTTSSASALYTVPSSGVTTTVKEIIISNPTSTAASVSVYFVPSGRSADNTTVVVPGITVAGNSFYKSSFSTILNANDAIKASSSAGTTLTLTVSGVEISA